MSALVPPPQTRIIGRADKNGQVSIDIAWFRYLSQGLFDRVGGALGVTNKELVMSQFEDAGIEETKALVYANHDGIGQSLEVAALRAEIATLRNRLDALEQGVSM